MSTLVQSKYRLLGGWTELLLLLVAIVWGTSYGLTKEALAYVGVFGFIAIRFGITFLLLLPKLIKDCRSGQNRDWLRALPTGTVLAMIFACEVTGVLHTSATHAAVLISLSMIFTAILESVLSRTGMAVALWWMVGLSTLGVVLLCIRDDVILQLNYGDGLILMAAIGRAIMVTLTKKMTQGRSLTMLSLTAIQALIVTLVALFLMLKTGEDFSLSALNHAYFWGITAYLVLMCTLFAFWVQNMAVSKTSPTRVALLMGSEPLFGALFAMIWLGESLDVLQWLGALCIIVSVVQVSIQREQP